MTTLATAEPLPLARRLGVGLAACAFVSATVWQVAAGRDDWPLSCFSMYSHLQGPVSKRSFVRGVSDQGEFELADEMLPVGGARLRHLNEKLARDKKRQRRFAQLVQERYAAAREQEGWPELQAIRAYNESWRIQRGLKGIDKPKRRMVGVLYIPPPALVQRLKLERKSNAPVAPPRRAKAGDVIVDPGAGACAAGCEAFSDRLAASGQALRLSADEGEASASLTVDLEPGSWSLLVRMRTPAAGGSDRIRVALDGELLGGKAGLGHYESALGRGGWIWASRGPGLQALSFEVKARGAHALRFEVPRKTVEIDEVWLGRGPRELPIWNEPVVP